MPIQITSMVFQKVCICSSSSCHGLEGQSLTWKYMSHFPINPPLYSPVFPSYLLYTTIKCLTHTRFFFQDFIKILKVFCNFKTTIIITFLHPLTSHRLVLLGMSQMKLLVEGIEWRSTKWEVGTSQKSPSRLTPGSLWNTVNSILLFPSRPEALSFSQHQCLSLSLTPIPHPAPIQHKAITADTAFPLLQAPVSMSGSGGASRGAESCLSSSAERP